MMQSKSWIDGKFCYYTTKLFSLTSFARYAQIRTFGRLTIRKFNKNVSAMKEFAARDYEQLLIVSVYAVGCQEVQLNVIAPVCDSLL